jgi:hypothetical protein
MPGWNLLKYRSRFLQQVAHWQGQAVSPAHIPDVIFLELMNDALRETQDELGIDKVRETANLADGTMTVAVPTTLMGRKFNRIDVENESDDGYHELTHLPYDQFVASYDVDAPGSNKGVPNSYTWSKSNQRQILLGPSPSFTKSSAVIFTGDAVPDMVGRWFNGAQPPDGGTAVTATGNNGSSSVTLSSGTYSDIEIGDDDEFGVGGLRQIDGATPATEIPRKWYGITSVATTALTLDGNYGERNFSTQTFMTAEVSQLEKAWPGGLGVLPVEKAIAAYFEVSNPPIFQIFENKWLRGLAKKRPHIVKKHRTLWAPTAREHNIVTPAYT